MHQKKTPENGILFNSVIRLSFNRPMNMAVIRFLRLLIVIAGAYAPVQCLVSCMGITDGARSLLPAVLIAALLLEAVQMTGRARYVLYPALAAVAFAAAFLRRAFIIEGFYIFRNIFVGLIEDYYDLELPLYAVNSAGQEKSLGYMVIVLAVLMAVIVELGISLHLLRIICLTVGLMFVAAGFAVGMIPDTLPFLIYILYVTSFMSIGTETLRPDVYIDGAVQRKQYTRFYEALRLKTAMLCTIVLLLLFAVARLLLQPSFYEEKIKVQETKEKLQEAMNDLAYSDLGDWISEHFAVSDDSFFSFLQRDKDETESGVNGGKINMDDRLRHRNKAMLSVTLPKLDSDIYLKGYAAGRYDGRSWGQLSDKSIERYYQICNSFAGYGINAINMTYHVLQLMAEGKIPEYADLIPQGAPVAVDADIGVEFLGDDGSFTYLPYYTSENGVLGGYARADDYLVRYGSEGDYNAHSYIAAPYLGILLELAERGGLSAELGGEDGLTAAVAGFEQLYREYVYDSYLDVPERLTRLNALEIEGGEGVFGKIKAVRSYLHQNNHYTLAPGAPPEGEDYIEYFLFENHKGYCVHFASAAVMLLRKLGVPARFAEGYHIGRRDMANGDAAGHADGPAYSNGGISDGSGIEWVNVVVRDTSAHAWVEVYIDGFGWYPVEMTPGFQVVEAPPGITEAPGNVPSETPEAEPTPQVSPTEAPQTPEPGPTLGLPQEEGQNVQPSADGRWMGILIQTLLAAVAAAAAAWLCTGLVRLRFHRRKHREENMEAGQRILWEYKKMFEILRSLGMADVEEADEKAAALAADSFVSSVPGLGEGFKEAYSLAQLARFGGRAAAADEAVRMIAYKNLLLDKLYANKSKILRLYYKYIKVF